MNKILTRGLLIGGIALLAWGLAPAGGTAAPGLQASPVATPAYFTASLAFAPPVAAAPALGVPLPTSAFPNSDAVCSVNFVNTPNRCTMLSSTAASRCSAHCDADQRCSALAGPAGLVGNIFCSVFSRNNRACSVLQPPGGPPNGQAFCSAENFVIPAQVACSIMNTGAQQKCSSQNPTVFGGICSAIAFQASRAQCSVLNGGTASNNFCTTKFPGNKLCSTFEGDTTCSILLGQRGRCTVFSGAVGNCSTFGTGGPCSVIGGASGTVCIQP